MLPCCTIWAADAYSHRWYKQIIPLGFMVIVAGIAAKCGQQILIACMVDLMIRRCTLRERVSQFQFIHFMRTLNRWYCWTAATGGSCPALPSAQHWNLAARQLGSLLWSLRGTRIGMSRMCKCRAMGRSAGWLWKALQRPVGC